jgi:PAS domain S-box-containing protein
MFLAHSSAFVSLVCGVASLAMGIVIYGRNPKNKSNILFLYLCSGVAYWGFIEFQYCQAPTSTEAFFWMRMGLPWLITVAVALHFVLAFTEATGFLSKRISSVLIYGPPAVFFAIGTVTGLMTGSPVKEYWGWTFALPHNLVYDLGSLWAVLVGLTAIGLTVRYYFTIDESAKKQRASYVVVGFLVAAPFAFTTEILFHYLDIAFPPLSAPSFALVCAIVGYGMWKHKLFAISAGAATDSILDTMSDGLLLVGMDKKIKLANRAALHMLEYEPRQLIGQPVDIVFAPRDGAVNILFTKGTGFRGLIKTVIKGDVEATFVTRSGANIPVSISGSLIRDTDNDLLGIVCIARDITERLRAKEALQKAMDELEVRVDERTAELRVANETLRREIAEREEAEKQLAAEKERLDVTLRSIADGVITVDTNKKIVLVNRVAEQLTGCGTAEAVGRPVAEVFATSMQNGAAAPSPVITALDTGIVVETREPVVLRGRDNVQRLVSQSAAPIRDNAGTVVGAVLVFADITQQSKIEQELFRARKLESVGVLASGIAHSFNNILTGIITNLFVAKTHLDSATEAYGLITESEKAAFKASTLTNQLLTFSREGAPVKVVTSLSELIENSVGFFLSGSNVDYQLDIGDGLWDVEVDRGQIEQALQNIISNADEAMPDGGTIVISAQNSLQADRSTLPMPAGNYVRVSVQDEGNGIAQEDLDRIFDPYFSRKKQGAGLGLAAAYAIIKKHDGHLTVSSELGKGTTVSLYLPACAETNDTEPDAAAESERSDTEQQAQGKILLMDDEEIIRSAGKRLLTSLGYKVETCAEGKEALDLYSQARSEGNPFDAVILDLTVAGGMGGTEAMKKLLDLDEEAKGIVSSGYTHDPVMSNYKEYGFCAVISKPYNIDELRNIIQSAIQS